MMRVKIFGAGSIGNHLSHAARTLGWSVDVCDVNPIALERMRCEIYPSRYGKWDDGIGLYTPDDVPVGRYDLIAVGTPPDTHLNIAKAALEEAPQALLIEKPLADAGLGNCKEFWQCSEGSKTKVFVGYDHVVGKAIGKVGEILASGRIGTIATIDVEFREHWGGIFAAHPWLDGPADSYLGHWRRGGGAAGEHSHAVNLWQHLAHVCGAGRVIEVSAVADYVSETDCEYDRICAFALHTERGLFGRVVQDVVTSPPRKWGRVQGENGYVEWEFSPRPGCDVARWSIGGGPVQHDEFVKSRPDDFIAELLHISSSLEGKIENSPIALGRGMDTMLVVAAAHVSSQRKRAVRIDYDEGPRAEALCPVGS